MAKKELQAIVMEQKILNRIYVVRGQKIMLDEDQINFKAITEFYDKFLTAYYSMEDFSLNFQKLKLFRSRLLLVLQVCRTG